MDRKNTKRTLTFAMATVFILLIPHLRAACNLANGTVLEVELKSITFNTDHGIMTNHDSDWGSGGGSVYPEPEWTANQNHPISHTKDAKVGVDVVICVQPAGLAFDLEGDSAVNSLDFHKTGLTSSGADQTVSLTADVKLPNNVDVVTEDIEWKVKVAGIECSAGVSGPHVVYVTWGTPSGTEPTVNRIDWVCDLAQGASSLDGIASVVEPDAVGGSRFGSGSIFGSPPTYSSAWELLDPDPTSHTKKGDCGSLSTLMKYELDVLGTTGAEVRFVYARHASWPGLSQPSPPYTSYNETDGSGNKLGLWFGGGLGSGWNNYEGCCVFQSKWWEGGNGISKNSAYEVLLHVTSPNTDGSGNSHQCWSHDQLIAVPYPSGTP